MNHYGWGGGEISASSLDEGESLFAGPDWAFHSVAGGWSTVGTFLFIAIAALVSNVIIWVSHSRHP
uniref:Uncharacterized protein n=1 Tax=Streptomyces sp. NBC_01401 TaxID=2903854 RepID=A0AAU3H160_9ACTN